VTLTVPGQAGEPFSTVMQAVKNDVDAISIMEYDIWVDPSKGYAGTIKEDVDKLIQSGISNLQLGLMPGSDDMGHILTPDDMQELIVFAKGQKLLVL